MAEGFSRWESDPLFSAAEVVQDSADRMDSVFRTLLHEQSSVQGDPSDSKHLGLIQYHRRDLATALETTRWQLEDFEREVNLAALYDKSKSRENAISKHRQFIRAIKEQILQVERSVGSSMEVSSKNPQWMNSNEQDADGLASFLSGGDFTDHNVDYNTGSSIMKRFLDSNMDNDEIVELKAEEVEVLPMNGMKNSDHCYDSSKNHMSWKIGSHVSSSYDLNESSIFQGSTEQKESAKSYTGPGAYDLEFGDLSVKCYSYKNRLKGSLWGFLRNFWLVSKSEGNFTKRRKDGEVADDLVENQQWMTASTVNIPSNVQGSNRWGAVNSMQFYSWFEVIHRRLHKARYLILNNQFCIRLALAILATLIVLGFLVFRIG